MFFGCRRTSTPNNVIGRGDKAVRRAASSLFRIATASPCAERAYRQFESLSLRQLGRSRIFSARNWWQLSPVAVAISHLNSGLLIWNSRSFSPNGPFLSGALDSADSVRFSKFECFERLMNFNEMGFCSSSWTGKSIRFRIRHIDVRILPPQPPIQVFGRTAQETREWAGNPGFSCIRFGLRAPSLPMLRRKLPKVSGLARGYSRLRRLSAETSLITTAARPYREFDPIAPPVHPKRRVLRPNLLAASPSGRLLHGRIIIMSRRFATIPVNTRGSVGMAPLVTAVRGADCLMRAMIICLPDRHAATAPSPNLAAATARPRSACKLLSKL